METTNNVNGRSGGSCGCEKDHHGKKKHTHVHELVGSVRIDGNCCDCENHNHRFTTVTGEAEYKPGVHGHVHKVKFSTDTYDGHYHEFCGYTEGSTDVGCGRHVHLIKDETERSDRHDHCFIAATLIEDPINEEK